MYVCGEGGEGGKGEGRGGEERGRGRKGEGEVRGLLAGVVRCPGASGGVVVIV